MSAAWLCWGGGGGSCFNQSWLFPRFSWSPAANFTQRTCPRLALSRCGRRTEVLLELLQWIQHQAQVSPPPPSLPQKAPTCPKPVQADSCAPPTLDPEPGRLRAARLARQVWVSADCSCFFSTQHPAPSTNPGDPDPFSSTIQTIHPPIVPEQIPSHPPPPPGLFFANLLNPQDELHGLSRPLLTVKNKTITSPNYRNQPCNSPSNIVAPT